MNMVDFYLKLTKKRIEDGMDKETALSKVPAKYREAVRAALEADISARAVAERRPRGACRRPC